MGDLELTLKWKKEESCWKLVIDSVTAEESDMFKMYIKPPEENVKETWRHHPRTRVLMARVVIRIPAVDQKLVVSGTAEEKPKPPVNFGYLMAAGRARGRGRGMRRAKPGEPLPNLPKPLPESEPLPGMQLPMKEINEAINALNELDYQVVSNYFSPADLVYGWSMKKI